MQCLHTVADVVQVGIVIPFARSPARRIPTMTSTTWPEASPAHIAGAGHSDESTDGPHHFWLEPMEFLNATEMEPAPEFVGARRERRRGHRMNGEAFA